MKKFLALALCALLGACSGQTDENGNFVDAEDLGVDAGAELGAAEQGLTIVAPPGINCSRCTTFVEATAVCFSPNGQASQQTLNQYQALYGLDYWTHVSGTTSQWCTDTPDPLGTEVKNPHPSVICNVTYRRTYGTCGV